MPRVSRAITAKIRVVFPPRTPSTRVPAQLICSPLNGSEAVSHGSTDPIMAINAATAATIVTTIRSVLLAENQLFDIGNPLAA